MSNPTGHIPGQKTPRSLTATFKAAAFERDIKSLFGHKKGGHTSRWTYNGRQRPANQPSGSKLWSAFLKNCETYYIPKQEIALINASTAPLSEIFSHADTIVDFGSGDSFAFVNKVLPILEHVRTLEGSKLERYVPLDVSQQLLEEVARMAQWSLPYMGRWPSIKTELAEYENGEVAEKFFERGTEWIYIHPIHGDFYRNKILSGEQQEQKISLPGQSRAGLMLGSTISNMNMTLEQQFPEKDIVKKLKSLGKLMIGDNPDQRHTLALSFDANTDLAGSALRAYDDDSWRQMISSIMIDVETVLEPEGNFDAFSWEYKGVPDERNHVIHQCVVATERQEFKIGSDTFTVQKGDAFVIVNNFKYPVDLMRGLIKDAGYAPKQTLRQDGNNMVIQTMDLTP